MLAEVIIAENVSKLTLPTVISLAQDSVANVRFNVAKTLKKLGPKIEKRLDTKNQYKYIWAKNSELTCSITMLAMAQHRNKLPLGTYWER